MLTGPEGPVKVFLTDQPEAIFAKFYWPCASGSLLASGPEYFRKIFPCLYASAVNGMVEFITIAFRNRNS